MRCWLDCPPDACLAPGVVTSGEGLAVAIEYLSYWIGKTNPSDPLLRHGDKDIGYKLQMLHLVCRDEWMGILEYVMAAFAFRSVSYPESIMLLYCDTKVGNIPWCIREDMYFVRKLFHCQVADWSVFLSFFLALDWQSRGSVIFCDSQMQQVSSMMHDIARLGLFSLNCARYAHSVYEFQYLARGNLAGYRSDSPLDLSGLKLSSSMYLSKTGSDPVIKSIVEALKNFKLKRPRVARARRLDVVKAVTSVESCLIIHAFPALFKLYPADKRLVVHSYMRSYRKTSASACLATIRAIYQHG